MSDAIRSPIDNRPQAESPKRTWLGDIAQVDPKLAYTLLQSGRVGQSGGLTPGGYVDTGGWEIINLKASFPEDAPPGTVALAQLSGIVEADLWVRRVTYTVRRPEAFAGNIFKSQADYYNSLNPNIDFTLIIKSYNRYVVSPEPTPLENISTVFEAVAPAGLVLRTASSMSATFTNMRSFDGEGADINAVISFHATRLPTGIYGAADAEMAAALLREMGYLPSCATGVDGQND